VLRNYDKKEMGASQTRLLKSMLGVTLREKVRREDIKQHVETENIVSELGHYQTNLKENEERMTPESLSLPWEAYY
jgi:hypothetical protein